MQVSCPRCGPVEVEPGAPHCPLCGNPVAPAGGPALPPRIALPPPPRLSASFPALGSASPPPFPGGPPPFPGAPPFPVAATPPSPPEEEAAQEDVGGRTMMFDDVIKIPPPRSAVPSSRPNLDAQPEGGTQRFSNVLSVPDPSRTASGRLGKSQTGEAPAAPASPLSSSGVVKKTSQRMLSHSLESSGEGMRRSVEGPAPTAPAAPAPVPAPAPAPGAPAAATPPTPPAPGADDSDDGVGGRTMVFGDVMRIPPPPKGSAAAAMVEEAQVTAKARAEREELLRRPAHDGAGGRVLLLMGIVLGLGGAVFAAGFALSESFKNRQLLENIQKAKNELDHNNPTGALIYIDANGGAAKVNAEAQVIRARAALLTKKSALAQGAVQIGLRDSSATAHDRAQLQSVEGELNLASGDVLAAVAALEQAVLSDPKNGQAHRLLGEAYLLQEGQDKLVAAKHELDEALNIDPSTPRARLLRARVELHLGDRDGAEKDLEVAGRDASDLEARLARGDLRLRDGDAPAALEDAVAVEKAAPQPAGGAPAVGPWREALLLRARCKLIQGDAPGALEALDPLRKAGVDDHELKIELARASYVAGRYDEAARLWEPLLQADVPGNAAARASEAAERALVLLAADRSADANEATLGAPNATTIHAAGRLALAKAYLLLQTSKADESFRAAKEAADILADARALGGGSPIFAIDGVAVPAHELGTRATILAGRAALRQGDENKAQGFFDKAAGTDQRSIVALVARASELMRRGENARAAADLDTALQRSPDSTEALRLRAALAFHSGDLAKASSCLEHAIASGGHDPTLHLDLARAHAARGQADAALTELERARELGLPFGLYADGRWQVALAKGDHADAESWLSRVIERRPYDLDAIEARAKVRLLRGNTPAALDDYRSLRALAPRPEYDRAIVRVYLADGDTKRAGALLTAALARAPKDAELHGLQGRLYLTEHHYSDAVRELRAALVIDENLAQPTLDLALALAYAGEDGADTLARRARALDPDSEPIARLLTVCEELGSVEFGLVKSWKTSRLIAASEPTNRRAHAICLKVAIARKDWGGLLDAANKCLQAFPGDSEATLAQSLARKNGAKEGKTRDEAFGTDDKPPPVVVPKDAPKPK